MSYDDTRKIVLVGTGFVGMSYAYSLLNQGVGDELVLIDIDKRKVEGEAMDLNHGLAFAPKHMKIYGGDYVDCKDADLVVITAGLPQKEGETRLDLLNKNAKIMKEIVGNIMKSGFNGLILVASNPVDIMTYIAYKVSGLPKNHVFGSGTSLDSARLRYLLSDYLKIDSKNIHAYIVGEHGDSEFPLWSNAFVGIKPLLDVVNEHDEYKIDDLHNIYVDVRDAAYKIIARKKSTYYGIGMALCQITKVIFNDSNSIVPVSIYIDDYYGVNDLYIGMPAIINRDGIRELIKINMTKTDQEKFVKSANILKEMINQLSL
ncbi:MAG: L-lactate dehydrogenase [Haloplasmataceae bacterium]|jgi:L-lactate dehydrogenase|nr:L-lactate dehydrogenase [Haloplasmataceae bacterium]